MRKALQGVRLYDGWAHAEKIHRLSRRNLKLWIREGRKREVRRIFEALGYEVLALCRVGFGPLSLGMLQPGEGRFLRLDEVKKLKEEADNSKS
jgi:23S rRNA pseudouridine2605 synthase